MPADRRAFAWLLSGAALIVLAVLPGLRPWLEATLARHLLLQYPLLIAGGAIFGSRMGRAIPAPWLAAPALLLGLLAVAFWALPRWLDAAATDPAGAGSAKVASLVLLAGLPLGWGWQQAGPVLRGFVWANVTAMAALMGWLQLIVPVRLCNSYLVSDQEQSGRILLALALVAVVAGGARALFATPRHR